MVDPEEAYQLGAKENCVERIDALFYCFSPVHQVGTYYAFGLVDPCRTQMSDFYDCLRLKMNLSADEKRKLIRKMNQRDEFSPTKGVWEFREDPEKDWNKHFTS